MKLTEEMVSKAEAHLKEVGYLNALADERLTVILIACQLYRMEQTEKEQP